MPITADWELQCKMLDRTKVDFTQSFMLAIRTHEVIEYTDVRDVKSVDAYIHPNGVSCADMAMQETLIMSFHGVVRFFASVIQGVEFIGVGCFGL